MQFTALFSFLCLLFWVPQAVAQSVVAQSSIIFSKSTTICRTQYATTACPKPTPSNKPYTTTKSYSFTFTSTPIVKFTPPAVTVWVTNTTRITSTTTRSPITNTYTSTIISNILSTVTAPTSTAISTLVVTSTTSITSTTSFGASVTPVQNTLPGGLAKREQPKRSRVYGRQSKNPANILTNKKNPKAINCSVVNTRIIVYIFRKTAPTKTITISVRPTTLTSTTVTTILSVSTVVPPNSYSTITTTQLVTAFTTTTPIFSTTSTTTSIEVAVAAIETVYPQCGPANYVTSVNGAPIINADAGSVDVYVNYGSAPTREQCCIDCLLDPSCGLTLFVPGLVSGYPMCISVQRTDMTCDPANPLLVSAITATNPLDEGIISISNNECGAFDRTDES